MRAEAGSEEHINEVRLNEAIDLANCIKLVVFLIFFFLDITA